MRYVSYCSDWECDSQLGLGFGWFAGWSILTSITPCCNVGIFGKGQFGPAAPPYTDNAANIQVSHSETVADKIILPGQGIFQGLQWLFQLGRRLGGICWEAHCPFGHE